MMVQLEMETIICHEYLSISFAIINLLMVLSVWPAVDIMAYADRKKLSYINDNNDLGQFYPLFLHFFTIDIK
jgi:hypothetical protein